MSEKLHEAARMTSLAMLVYALQPRVVGLYVRPGEVTAGVESVDG